MRSSIHKYLFILRSNKGSHLFLRLFLRFFLTALFLLTFSVEQGQEQDFPTMTPSQAFQSAETNAAEQTKRIAKRNWLLIQLTVLEGLIIGVLIFYWWQKKRNENAFEMTIEELYKEIALKESQIEGQKISLKNIFNQSQFERRTIKAQKQLIEEMKKTLVQQRNVEENKNVNYLSSKFLDQPLTENKKLQKIAKPSEINTTSKEKSEQNVPDKIQQQSNFTPGKVPTSPPLPLNNQRDSSEWAQQRINLERKNKDTLDSINYARQIQDAILPNLEDIQKVLPESFVLYKPRDIVSGDFYWFDAKNHRAIISALDCTGHGVPGAFLSMIANELLNKTVQLRQISDPDKILNQLQLEMRNTLNQKENGNEDGMDIAICTIHQVPPGLEDMFGKPRVEFSGARSSIIYIQNNKLFRLRGDRVPIGGYLYEEDHKYTKHVIELNHPTTFYLFSDGFQDQFGGSGPRKKFMISRFKELLLRIHHKPMEEQKKILEKTLREWMGTFQQLDDILVLGVHIDLKKPFI